MQVTIALNQLNKIFQDRGITLAKYRNSSLIRINKNLQNFFPILFNACIFSTMTLGLILFFARITEIELPIYIIGMLCIPFCILIFIIGLWVLEAKLYTPQNYMKWYQQNITFYDFTISIVLSNFVDRDYTINAIEQIRAIMIEEYKSYISNVNRYLDKKYIDQDYILYIENLTKVWQVSSPETIEYFQRCFEL
jgi:hypothetical protein